MAASMESILFQATLLFWSLLIAEAQVMTPSGCQSHCGDVMIPYPFGMKAGCYLEERFKIGCINSTSGGRHHPRIRVNGTDLVVRDISVEDSTINVDFPIVFANCSGKERNTVVNLKGSPFYFSSKSNYFIAGGCDNLALMTQNESTVGGCMSICAKRSDNAMTSSSGINCCQTRIPSYLRVFNVTLKGVDDGKGSRDYEECRYAFLVDQSWTLESAYGYYDWNSIVAPPYSMRGRDYLPVVLDWGIDKRVFESLVSNGSFYNSTYTSECRTDLNPSSINSTDQQSSTVRCSCTPGFRGNPYLDGICEDVPEFCIHRLSAEYQS